MPGRDLPTLLADKETPETIRSALAALKDILPNPMPERHAAGFAELLAELEAELRTIESQGSLF